MEINKEDFLANFKDVFDETDVTTIDFDTVFKNLDEWDSMLALTIIAMADDEYGIKLTGQDIRSSSTVNDLYEIIKNK